MRAIAAGFALAALTPSMAGADAEAPDPPPPVQTLVEPGEVAADLRLQHMPVRMKLRAAPVPAPTKARPKRAAQVPAAMGAEPSVSERTPVPLGPRVLENIRFHIRAGVELDTAGASGETQRGGARLPADFSDARAWFRGDLLAHARNIALPSLGAYVLMNLQLDASDSLASRAASVAPIDAADEPLVIQAGYVDYGRDDVHPDKKLWLRGGRQFRLDGGSLFAYFDGATIGYRDRGWDVSAFAGQRVALYTDTPRGITYGATAAIDLGATGRAPLKLAANAMGLTVNQGDGRETRLASLVQATYALGKGATLHGRARIVDNGGGLDLGRAGGRLKVGGRSVVFVADVEQRRAADLAYDLASPGAVDVVQIAEKLGVGLSAPIDALTAGARVDWRNRKGSVELLAFARAEVPQGTVTTVDQRGWYEGGAALAGAPLGARGRGVWATAQYKIRQYEAADDASDDMGSAFGDTSTSGLDRMHEVAVDGTLYGGGAKRWRFNLGGFYRVYDFRSPYVEVTNEGRGGGRADLQIWLAKAVRGELAAEIAEPSPVLARELGVMSSIRGAVEARW